MEILRATKCTNISIANPITDDGTDDGTHNVTLNGTLRRH